MRGTGMGASSHMDTAHTETQIADARGSINQNTGAKSFGPYTRAAVIVAMFMATYTENPSIRPPTFLPNEER